MGAEGVSGCNGPQDELVCTVHHEASTSPRVVSFNNAFGVFTSSVAVGLSFLSCRNFYSFLFVFHHCLNFLLFPAVLKEEIADMVRHLLFCLKSELWCGLRQRSLMSRAGFHLKALRQCFPRRFVTLGPYALCAVPPIVLLQLYSHTESAEVVLGMHG